MSNFEDLNLDKIELPDKTFISLPILITLNDEYLEGKSERKTKRLWDVFYKSFGGTKEKKTDEYQAVGDLELPDDDPFKNKEHVFAIDVASFGKIEPKQEKNLDFGIRILQNNNRLLPVDSTMQEKGKEKNISNGLEFSEVEENVEETFKYISSLAETKRFESISDEKREDYESKKEEEEIKENQSKENNFVSATENIGVEDEENSEVENTNVNEDNTESVTDDDSAESTPIEVDGESETGQKNESEGEESEVYDLPDDDLEEIESGESEYTLNSLKQNLYSNLQSYFPHYNLKDLDFDGEVPELEDKEYQKLYAMTAKGINDQVDRANKKIALEREKSINNLYRPLISEVVKRYFDIEALYKYTDSGSEFNTIYETLENNLNEALKNVEIQADEQEQIKKQKHKKNKESYLNNLLKKESIKYDEENLPKITEEVESYKEESKSDIYNKYNSQIDQLEDDVESTVTERIERLVDNVINEYKPQLDSAIETLNSDLNNQLEKIAEQNQRDWQKYKEQLKEIEEVRTKAANSQRSTIDAEVSKRTQAYEGMQQKLEEKDNQIHMLQANLRNAKESSTQKDYTLDSAATERQELLKRMDKKEAYIAELEQEREEKNAKIRQLSSSNSYIGYPFNHTPTTKVGKTKEVAKSWYDKFEKLIIATVASIIIAIGVLIAATIVSSNDADSSSQQNQIQKQQEEVKSQQEEQDKKASELEEKEKQQEEQQKKLDQQKKDNESKKDSKDKDKDK